MGNQASAPSQIISLPKGGGALKGIGEKFSPDLFTGTGNFTIPIALPPGRNGFQPELNLVYSTGNGNGLFGLGWSLSIPGVTRKTSKGIPRYRDEDPDLKKRDTFVLSGAEDLVPLDTPPAAAVQYRPRTEGLFARIEHHRDTNDDFWQVSSKDGLVSFYGTPNLAHGGTDSAVIRKPKLKDIDRSQIFSWKLSLTKDPFGNRIEYLYDERDQSTAAGRLQGHDWDQTYLSQIRYVDYEANNQTQFLVTVKFEYEGRPDPFSDYRSGFEVRTTKRCIAVLVETHADRDYKVRRYEFTYSNNALNGGSHLAAINIVGFDDQDSPVHELPPVEFGYTDFNPQDQQRRDFYPIHGKDLPTSSLANSSMELVDLFGNGLPDILEMNGSVRYWRNLGNGHFDMPRSMRDAPAGFGLADAGVQLIDANGDGRTDLLVTQPGLAGYFPLEFGGKWDRRSMRKYEVAPSFDLKDPEVRLVDITGDGVTDVIRSGSRLECFFNDQEKGWHETRWVERKALEEFPDVSFSDPRVKWSDMSGDGLQDIVLAYDGSVEYWPNLGYGDWGRRIHMRNSPRFPLGYDPKRILVGDIDGDGLADLVYVDDRKVHLWINQSGNSWSDEIVIQGTPPVSDTDAVRLTDLLGSGVSGILWTRNASLDSRAAYFFLDLTGGTKPYLLHEMNNNMGAITRVGYAPSTKSYLRDEKNKKTRWKTPLPFPVQVVEQVEVIDELSRGKLTTKYDYHHGYWDGAEREFRGFGMVEQFDTESFDDYKEPGLFGEATGFAPVELVHFSPPIHTKTWFHQGPAGEEFGEWKELNLSDEFWAGDLPLLGQAQGIEDFLESLPSRRARRDALRALRGSILRTELYAVDGSELENSPYTVTEYAYGLREEFPPAAGEKDRPHIFFSHGLGQRTTQWERGTDPMTHFNFSDDFDDVGQSRRQTQIACPRGWRNFEDRPGQPYLSTRSRTVFATPLDSDIYIRDRVAQASTYEIKNSGSETVAELRDLPDSDPVLAVIGQNINFYDRDESPERRAFLGLAYGQVGQFGALVRTERLVLTDSILEAAYGNDKPPYFSHSGTVSWTADYPSAFRVGLTSLAGYAYHSGGTGSEYTAGYFVATERRRYDFHSEANGRGLVIARRDPLGSETIINHDLYGLLPTEITDAADLHTTAEYSYRVLQPRVLTDPNGNETHVSFTPSGLPRETRILGKTINEGDQLRPSITLHYDFLAYLARGEPVRVHTVRQLHHDTETDVPLPQRDQTIETSEYSDGFGRLIQTRTQGEDLVFADSSLPPAARDLTFASTVVPRTQPEVGGDVVGYAVADPINAPRVVVSGWQVYDNKGRVVERYEPFFSEGWSYTPPTDDQLGQKSMIFYDALGRIIRTLNADGSEQRVIFGVPNTLDNHTNPDKMTATPWEVYTYDVNDNAGRTHPNDSAVYRHHQNTPSNIVVDAMGRTILAVERNRPKPAGGTAALPVVVEHKTSSTFDLQGNLLTVTDPLNRVAFKHVYDLAKRPLRLESIDCGFRIIVSDAIGNEIERRDSKGALALRSYDILHRPAGVWARNDALETMTLREKLSYGDGGRPDQPAQERAASRANNSLGKRVVHKDEAGELEVGAYDFKGNLLVRTRKVITDGAIIAAINAAGSPARTFTVDWDNPPSLEGVYETSMNYDALNRIKTITYPRDVGGSQPPLRKVLDLHYNRAGVMEQVTLDTAVYVERIAYNAKGQRIFIAYGNGIMTRYSYDPKTFRLVRMRTEKYLKPLAAVATYKPIGGLLQDYSYEYDLAGNILAIHERVTGCGVNGSVDGSDALNRVFEYDPLYRLTRATGRESNNILNPRPWEDSAREGYNSGNHGTANQDNAPSLTREYWEEYEYDPAGNVLAIKHSNNWTRRFGMAGFTPKQWQQKVSDFLTGNSPDWGTQGNRLSNFGTDENQGRSHTYDDNGNLTREFTNRHFSWDFADRMIAFADRPTVASPASTEAAYLYDSGGQRIKKLVRLQSGGVETATYIDSIFEYHRRSAPGQPTVENNTLLVTDNRSLVAMVRIGDAFPEDGAPGVLVKYSLVDHLESSNIVIGGASAAGDTFINREEYFPYGETSFGSFARKRYRFTGKERDEESGLNYHGARYCALWLSRWISCDPAGPIDGNNLFRYVRNNPLRNVDTNGNQTSGSNATPDAGIRPLKKENSLEAPPPTFDLAKICITGNESKAEFESKVRIWTTVGAAAGRDANLAVKADTLASFYQLHEILLQEAANDLSSALCGNKPFSTLTAGTYSKAEGAKTSDKVTDPAIRVATRAHELYHGVADLFLEKLNRYEAGRILDPEKYSVRRLQASPLAQEKLDIDIARCEEFFAYQITITYLFERLSAQERADASALAAAYAQLKDQRLFSRADNKEGFEFSVQRCYELLPGKFVYDAKKDVGTLFMPFKEESPDAGTVR